MKILNQIGMKKRIFNWGHCKDIRYIGRKCPNFDFVEGCKTGLVIWWNENQVCIDMDKLKKEG